MDLWTISSILEGITGGKTFYKSCNKFMDKAPPFFGQRLFGNNDRANRN